MALGVLCVGIGVLCVGSGVFTLYPAMQCNVRLYLMYLTNLTLELPRTSKYIRASPPALIGIRKDSTCVAKNY